MPATSGRGTHATRNSLQCLTASSPSTCRRVITTQAWTPGKGSVVTNVPYCLMVYLVGVMSLISVIFPFSNSAD